MTASNEKSIITHKRIYTVLLLSIMTGGCTGLPEGVEPVDGFEIDKYLGTWYEIARLDHSFERGLESVTAEYTLRDDGGVNVVNRGFSPEENTWKEAEGKAYFVAGENTGHLKVSFFGPFYGSYVVFELEDEAYQHAFVAGYSKSYLWLLSKTPVVSDELVARFISRSAELGFPVDNLIIVDHSN